MLTKGDVKIIGDLFDEKFDKKFEESFLKHTKSIKEDIVQIRKDQKLIIRFFDREYLDLRKRVERLESRLGISDLN